MGSSAGFQLIAEGFAGLSIFFTKEFVAAGGGPNPEAFAFFERDARHVFTPPPAEAASLTALLRTIGQKYEAAHAYREEILRSLVHVLLHETAPVYSAQRVAAKTGQTRSQFIAAEFKQLVNTHYATERSLAFYADRLCITPKHLAETVKEAIGKREARRGLAGRGRAARSPRAALKPRPGHRPDCRYAALRRPVHLRPVFSQ